MSVAAHVAMTIIDGRINVNGNIALRVAGTLVPIMLHISMMHLRHEIVRESSIASLTLLVAAENLTHVSSGSIWLICNKLGMLTPCRHHLRRAAVGHRRHVPQSSKVVALSRDLLRSDQ